ncbi:MAG: acyl-CoA dehydrogenase family protein, partial [Actinomycetota bacterium]
YDPWGTRIDQIEVDPAWTRLIEIGIESGLVAIPYEMSFGESSRVLQFGLQHIFMPVSAVADCPLSMTDAAARVLLNEDIDLARRYVPRLTARRNAWTSGQWMTEKQGGSDVGRSGTTATHVDGKTWQLHGTKWFNSATTADIALALARPVGAEQTSRGLSLFLLELRNADGSWNGIQVRRLKEKLGTRAVPTAELDLDGCLATQVGEIGRGVPKIATMLNITRVHAAFGGNSPVGQGLSLARDYAKKREAFGQKLIDLSVHRRWLGQIAAVYEAGLVLCFRAAQLLGATEVDSSQDDLARVVFPLAKMAAARQGVWGCSQIVESFGGVGYLEDSGIPRLLRDVHVQCIWEGTTSIMALDVVRALGRNGVAEAFLDDVESKLRSYEHPLTADSVRAISDALDELRRMLADIDEADARRLAWAMARIYQAALLAEAAGWALDKHADRRSASALGLFIGQGLIDAPMDLSEQDLHELATGGLHIG